MYFKPIWNTLLLFFLVPLSLFSLNDDKYYMTLTNTLSYDLTVEQNYKSCIKDRDYSALGDPWVLKKRSSAKITFKSDCDTGEKKNYLSFTPIMDESEQLPEHQYYLKVEFHHKNTSDGDGGLKWKTRINDTGNANVPFAVNTAEVTRHDGSWGDTWKNALGNWQHIEFDEDIKVSIGIRPLAEGQFRFDTINLGNVKVTNAYGKPVYYDPISHAVDLRDADEKFDVHFSKTSRFCKVRSGELICPSSIDYYYISQAAKNPDLPDERFVFACRQVETGDTACPWTTEHSEIGGYHL